MGKIAILSIVSVCLFNFAAKADVRYLDDVIAMGTAEEQSDLAKLLGQIELKPTKDPQSGKFLFQVKKVEKGSVYDRAGLKVGDFVSTGKAPGKNSELQTELERTDTN